MSESLIAALPASFKAAAAERIWVARRLAADLAAWRFGDRLGLRLDDVHTYKYRGVTA